MSKKPGLYANIHAKRKRGEKMRKPGEEGAPSAQDFKDAAKTAKKKKGVKRQDPKGNPAGYYDKEARYGSAKNCPKCKGDKEKCPGGKACPMSAKKDMGRKSPYADGMCKRGDIAAEFNAVMINDAERSDKPCGNSYIPQNAKCSKGAGQAKKGKAAENAKGRVYQSTKTGAKRGAILGGLYGAAVGASSGGLKGALTGAVVGGSAGSVAGSAMGYQIGSTKEFGRAEKTRMQRVAKMRKVNAAYKKAYTSAKASGATKQQMRALNEKYAQQFTKAYNYKR